MSLAASFLASTPPSVGLEVAARRVTAVAVDRAASGAVVRAHATEGLPAGALSLSLTSSGVGDIDALSDAIGRALAAVGKPKRVALVVPDTLAKVSLLRFETVPARAQDFEQLLRWQLRKTVPFPIEQAQVSWTRGTAGGEGGQEFVVAAMPRELVSQFVELCGRHGAHAGLVDLVTFNVVNTALLADRASGRGTGDWLLVHLTPEYTTLAIMRGEDLVFYRTRQGETEGLLPDVVHQTAMYYEDRLGGTGFSRVVVAAADSAVAGELAQLRRAVEGRLNTKVELLDPRPAAALADRIDAAPELLAAIAGPVGAVLRDA